MPTYDHSKFVGLSGEALALRDLARDFDLLDNEIEGAIDLLGLRHVDLDRLDERDQRQYRRAVEIQVNLQVAGGIDADLYERWEQGDRSATYAGHGGVSRKAMGLASELVARLSGVVEPGVPEYAVLKSLR